MTSTFPLRVTHPRPPPLILFSLGLMSALRFCLLLFLSVSTATCTATAAEEAPRAVNEVYHFHNGYQSETLELSDGRFRYWFSTDDGASNGKQALEGTYAIDGTTVTLHGPELHLGNKRIFHSFRGIEALWRPYALERWLKKGGLNTFGILFPRPHPPKNLYDGYFPFSAAAEAALQEEFRESKGLVDDGGAGLQEEFRHSK